MSKHFQEQEGSCVVGDFISLKTLLKMEMKEQPKPKAFILTTKTKELVVGEFGLEGSEYEDLEDIEYIKTLYLNFNEMDKIKTLLVIEEMSRLNGAQLNIVSDYCKIVRPVDDMWYISHGLPIPKRIDNENS